MRHLLGFLVSGLALTASQAMAGVVVTSTHTKLDTKQASPAMIYADTDRLKVVMPDVTVIYRADLNRAWTIFPQRQSYTEMTAETMQQMGGQIAGAQAQLGAAQAQMQAALAQMPPAQRAMMEQMMAGRGLGGPPGAGGPGRGAPAPAQASFVKAGGSKTVAGSQCDLYSKTVNGQKEEDVCIAPISAVGLSASDFRVLESFETFMAPVASSPLVPRSDYISWSNMNKAIGFQGLPLDTTIYANGTPTMQQTVNKIERTAIPANTFDLPPGLTKQEMPGLGGPGGRGPR